MQKFSLEKPEPDFDYLIEVMGGKTEPDRALFCEMLIDEEIKKFIIENYFEEENYPPVVTFGGSSGEETDIRDKSENKKAAENYYRQLINFYYRMGYSFLADYEFLVNFQSFNTVSRIGRDPDTAQFARDARHWAQEGKGLIQNWEDFEKFPWKESEELVLMYADHIDFLGRNLPDGMKLAVVGSVLEQVMEWIMGYEGVMYNVYDDPDLVGAVFDKVGKLVYDLYVLAAPMEAVGIIWHGDDLGYKSGTILSPNHLKKWVFPWFKKYAAIAHENNKPAWYHACGNKAEVMEDFIEDIRFDAIHSFEDPSYPVTEYKKMYGDRIGLVGGVDVDRMTRLNEEELREYVRGILNVCVPGGRYLLGSGNSVCSYIPVNNYLAMMDEGIKYFR
jgi:uroporphyrinogen decarboxylase